MESIFNFITPRCNSEIEICSLDYLIETHTPMGIIENEIKKQIINLVNEDTSNTYYFIYSYDLDVSKSRKKNTIDSEISIYIGKGNLQRTFKYKRDFHLLKTAKKLESVAIIKKKIITIIRAKSHLKINLNKETEKLKFEINSIKGEKPLFNKKDNGYSSREKHQYFSQIKALVNDGKIYILLKGDIPMEAGIDKKKLEIKIRDGYSIKDFKELDNSKKRIVRNLLLKGSKFDPNNMNDILIEFGVFNENFTVEDFYKEFVIPYKKLKK